MSANTLLTDIHTFISASLHDNLTEAERGELKFSNGSDILEAIENYFSDMEVDQEYDPFTDPEARQILGLAGINVHGVRR